MAVTVPYKVAEAAARLQAAAATRTPCAPVRDLLGPDDVNAAYAVQHLLTRERHSRGAQTVGRKIGLTSPAVQNQLGVNQPDFGVLFDDMGYGDGCELPTDRLLQPKIEAEIAFMLNADLVVGELDIAQVRDAIDYAVPALEVVDSRIAGWDIRFTDTVADNASSGLYVLGKDRQPLDSFNPADVEMRMMVDDVVVSTGNGAACLGDPLNAVVWLARTAREFGDPLRAGHIILSGALGPMHPVGPGVCVSAEITGLGSVATRFSQNA